jgi:hypothetical protein
MVFSSPCGSLLFIVLELIDFFLCSFRISSHTLKDLCYSEAINLFTVLPPSSLMALVIF